MPVSLHRNINVPTAKYLVFTSAGDNANLHCWLEGRRNFDLWVTYYGDMENPYKNNSDYSISKKGGKFPNLYYVYQNWADIIKHYEAIIVMDDDIVISGSDISRLFDIRNEYDLWLLQPAFDPKGKISHPITRLQSSNLLRFTNFVEVTCPLFRMDKLNDFMEIYNPKLVGWGIDYWYMHLLEPGIKGSVAVVDKISCINPHDKTKGGQREIDRLQATDERIKNWTVMKEKHRIPERKHIEYDAIPISAFHKYIGILRKLRRRIKAKAKKIIIFLDKLSPYPLLYPFIMSKDEKVIFDDAIYESSHYLEFGLGGSSLRALQKSKANIYTVESSSEWINYMRKYVMLKHLENKRLHIFYVNIGPTLDWGYPGPDNDKNLFEAYSSEVFESIDKKLIDLALVDGRFRVACVLKIILSCYENSNLKILIHDFWDREQYHHVLKYLDPLKRSDTIGLFSIKENVDIKSVEKDYTAYKFNPE